MIKIEPEPAADLVWYWGELLGSCPFWIFNPRIINLNGIQTPISNSACSAIYLFSLLEEKIKTGCDLKRVESKIIRDSKHPDWIWVLSELTFCFIPSCQCLVFTYASTWRVAHSPACSQLLQADAEICVSRHTVVSSLLASLFHHPSDRRMAAASKRFWRRKRVGINHGAADPSVRSNHEFSECERRLQTLPPSACFLRRARL